MGRTPRLAFLLTKRYLIDIQPSTKSRTRIAFRVHGMDCSEEISLLRRELSKVKGLYELHFEIIQARMTVEFDPGLTSVSAIQSVVAGAGLSCEPWDSESAAAGAGPKLNYRRWLTAASFLFLAAGAAVNAIFHGAGLLHLLAHQSHDHELHADVVALFALAIAAGFAPFAKKAWASLRAFRPDMNLLVAISIFGACLLGEWMEGATLAFLFALAAEIESWSASRARQAVSGLFSASPKEASVLHGDHEHRIPASKVKSGDRVAVRPGERIPCDGEVTRGESYVDQSLITGESVPVPKLPGSLVYAGTLNSGGYLEVRATRAASDTTVSRILRMVTESTQRRTRAELFIERFVRIYTPAVFGLAFLVIGVPPLLLGGDWSHWFYQGMVVLLISCPCALVISTPVTMVSALASAARHGVLIKGGAYLEEAARLKVMVFDKTGVLTAGQPSVVEFMAVDGDDPDTALARLASLESRSEHPLGRAILAYANQRGIVPVAAGAFEALPGRGVTASVDDRLYWAGGVRMMETLGLQSASYRDKIEALEADGCTVILCGHEQEAFAAVALSDAVRPEARNALESLHRMGVKHLAVLTGDGDAAARSATAGLPLDDIQTRLLPEEKAAAIRVYQRLHGPVAMVGDGFNDAPAMAEANVAIAMGQSATDLAVESADIVLMTADLNRLPFLIVHARRAARVIRENVAIALGLKVVFLAAAALGSATLWMAIAADMGATLLVTLNGLRLLSAKKA
ncbi:MAG: cation-translocating P-type ATPase [Bryobacteraceae bacterium]|nr:cation-translocating P-type ATPase [Bryobacteraceae bacterium]